MFCMIDFLLALSSISLFLFSDLSSYFSSSTDLTKKCGRTTSMSLRGSMIQVQLLIRKSTIFDQLQLPVKYVNWGKRYQVQQLKDWFKWCLEWIHLLDRAWSRTFLTNCSVCNFCFSRWSFLNPSLPRSHCTHAHTHIHTYCCKHAHISKSPLLKEMHIKIPLYKICSKSLVMKSSAKDADQMIRIFCAYLCGWQTMPWETRPKMRRGFLSSLHCYMYFRCTFFGPMV